MWSSVSVVIPVYNSFSSLDELYTQLIKVLETIFVDYEVILVDDYSSDDSFVKMREIHKKNNKFKVIRLKKNYGQQNAIKCGLDFASKDYVITMDDDLQHPPEEIINIMKKMDEEYDVVYGIAEKKEHNFLRNLGSKATNSLFNIICHKPKDIKVSSLRCIRKDVLKEIKKNKTSFVYISAIILSITKNIGNVYIKHRPRRYGKSNYNFSKLAKLFLKLYIYYSDTKLFKRFRKMEPQFEIYESYF
ncbi:glycosyltransferase family 2 protein [Clostridium sp. DL1XJH146]